MNDKIKEVKKEAYEVINPILYIGSRVERGEVITMTADEAHNIGKEYLSPYIEEPAVDDVDEGNDEDTDTTNTGDGEDGEGGDIETIDHTVTVEDLEENPELVANEVKEGDVIQIPKESQEDNK